LREVFNSRVKGKENKLRARRPEGDSRRAAEYSKEASLRTRAQGYYMTAGEKGFRRCKGEKKGIDIKRNEI